MDKELDDLLCQKFPNLYRDRNASMMETCMCWGFPRNGWFLLIYNLSSKLEKLILELPVEERKNCRASQVKEKFGTLRYYLSSGTEEMYRLTHEAESLSARICEECGLPGKLYTSGWYYTACPEHTEENDKKAVKEREPCPDCGRVDCCDCLAPPCIGCRQDHEYIPTEEEPFGSDEFHCECLCHPPIEASSMAQFIVDKKE